MVSITESLKKSAEWPHVPNFKFYEATEGREGEGKGPCWFNVSTRFYSMTASSMRRQGLAFQL